MAANSQQMKSVLLYKKSLLISKKLFVKTDLMQRASSKTSITTDTLKSPLRFSDKFWLLTASPWLNTKQDLYLLFTEKRITILDMLTSLEIVTS